MVSLGETHGFHEEEVLLPGFLNQEFELFGVGREGFFAEDVFAGFEAEHGVLVVVAVGRGDVDDVDVGVGGELFVGAVGFGGLGGSDFFEKFLGSVGGGRGGCSDDDVFDVFDAAGFRVGPEISGEGLSDAAGGKDAPFQLEFGHDRSRLR